jgi:hypothetical protein
MVYDHETYWPALLTECKTRREDDLRNWRALGEPRAGREERLWRKSGSSVKGGTKHENSADKQEKDPISQSMQNLTLSGEKENGTSGVGEKGAVGYPQPGTSDTTS